MVGALAFFPQNLGWEPGVLPDPATETTCKFCGELIRKRRDKTGNQFEWVSYLGIQPGKGTDIYQFSRFCRANPDDIQCHRRKPQQHGPIPLHDPKKLAEWLDT